MAADGAWSATDFEVYDGRPQRLLIDVRAVLARLDAQLSSRGDAPLSRGTAAALVQGLEELAAAAAQARNAELSEALWALAARLDAEPAAHPGAAAADLAELRAAAFADPGPIRAILVVAAACAALAVTGAGVLVLSGPATAPPILAAVTARLPSLKPLTPPAAHRVAPHVVGVAGLPQVAGRSDAAAMDPSGPGEASALPELTGLAQAGDTEAQLRLANLYETGQAGLPRDLAAARLWTRRAANGGHRVAMHNLGLFLTEGEGGLRDVAEAAGWFRRAADLGVVDSQYNLGLLYEAGRGAPQNLREAYRWFSVAANAGDLAAREKQLALEARLPPAERAALDREAAGYRPAAARAEPDPIVPPATTLAETQALLARRGYYVGPVDGVNSAQLKAAAAAWLRDHPGADPAS